MKNYNVAIASDHSGYILKDKIVGYLSGKQLTVKDFGTNSSETVDYPDYANMVVDTILDGESSTGILICGTGIGMSIAANRRLGIRAALCTDLFMAERSRSHNDANILVIPSKILNDSDIFAIVDKFLNTQFEGGRHNTRIAKLG
jgi:ribose 5-phosphate isomerase B